MKKLSLLRGSMILALAVGGLAGCAQQAQMARAAINPTDLQNLLNAYKDENGQYTKATSFYLNEASQAEASLFHNGAKTRSRMTYYNDTVGILLMGDEDGTFTSINSGYRNVESGAQHFTYKGTGADTSDLFTNRTDGWTAAGQSVGAYYPTLTSLANSEYTGADDWSWDDTYKAFVHNVTDLTFDEHGDYKDKILQKYQYFAAPMLLQNSTYFSWTSVRVTNATSFLSVRLYVSRASGDGKSTIVGETEALISEARIYKGLDFDPEIEWYLQGSFNSWGNTDKLSLQADIYRPEQYSITKNLETGDQFKFTNGEDYLGYDELENPEWFNRWNGGLEDNNAMAKLTGEYTFYLKGDVVYAAVPANGYVDITLDLVSGDGFTSSNNWTSSSAKIFAYVWNDDGNAWFEASSYTTVRVVGLYSNLILVRKSSSGTGGNWDNKWNQTVNLTIQHGKTLQIADWDGNVNWN